jgi:hypothetical protein
MIKRPAPYVVLFDDEPTVVIFRWWMDDGLGLIDEIQMYDDQALRMARDIIDTLEGRDHDRNH